MMNKVIFRLYLTFALAILMIILSAPARAAFPAHLSIDSPVAIAPVIHEHMADTNHLVRQSFLYKRINKIMSANKEEENTVGSDAPGSRTKRSGLFGRLSLYLGLLSIAAFITAICTLFTPFLLTAVVIWLYSDFFAVIFGTIGLVRRRKKGMAIAGIVLGVSMIALFFAVVSFLSAVVSALPGIMAAVILIGHI
jgi:hypothetical protein